MAKMKSKKKGRFFIPNDKKNRGFSLIEVIVAMCIFVLIIIVSVSAFASAFSARAKTRTLQRNLEEARTAIETISKNMRMSSKLASPDSTQITMFNNSQAACFWYQFTGNKLTFKRHVFSPLDVDLDPPRCSDTTGTGPYQAGANDSSGEVISIPVTGRFSVVPTVTSGARKLGRATISITVGTGTFVQNLQTSVSFRDYQGLFY